MNDAIESSLENDIFWKKVYRPSAALVLRKIAGELFIVPFSGELANMQRMFALTAVAEHIWQLLDGQRNMCEVRDAILLDYDADTVQAESDILEFIRQLLDAGLITE